MPSQRPPGRGKSPSRGPRTSSGHADTRRPRPASSGPTERQGPQARREGAPARREGAPPRPRPSGSSSRPRASQGDVGADRLQKILAHAGIASRRACEELILQGRVTVGGQIVKELGTKVDLAKISVAVDGQKIHQERLVYFAVNKPKGHVSTNNDPSGRPRVLDLMPQISQRVYTVGRLDEMSVGLMLLTNDGELANKLAHPKFGVEKLYRVIVAGSPERETLNQLTEGIWLAEGKVRAKRVRVVAKKGDATVLEMVLAEGKNREVRRMLAKLGHKVMMLTRVAVGPITLKGLAVGQSRPLTGKEVDLLRRVAAGEPVPMPWDIDHRPRPDADRPRRPLGTSGAADRRPSRDSRDQPRSFGSQPSRTDGPPRDARGPSRPHGPGYRGNDAPQDRRPGPGEDRFARGPADRRPAGGPPRRPGMFQATPDDRDRQFQQDRRPPQPRPDGPRPYSNNGPPSGPRGAGRPGSGPQGRPPYQAGGDSRPPRPGSRPGGDRPYQNNDRRPSGPGGPRPSFQNDDRRPSGPGGPRPPFQNQDRRPSGPGGPRSPQGDDRRPSGPGGPRSFQNNDRRPGGSDGPRSFQDHDRRPGGPGGPRPGRDDDRRNQQSGGPRRSGNDDRRDQRPPAGGDRRPLTNRRLPIPGSSEPTRKVIGLNTGPAPTPEPSDDRPKSRLKRPAPRGAAPGGSRPMPKRRPGARDDD